MGTRNLRDGGCSFDATTQVVDTATGGMPMPTGRTFAELFVGTRPSLRALAEGWHRAVGMTPTPYLRLFASLTSSEEVVVIKAQRAIKPRDGEPFDWLVTRRCHAVQGALDRIQAARGLPPVDLGPPPVGQPVGQRYELTDGDRLECRRIAGIVKRYTAGRFPVIVRVEGDGLPDRHIPDGGGWFWVKVCDVDGAPLRMGTGGITVGKIQCCTRVEAGAMASELREAIDRALVQPLGVYLASRGNPDRGEDPRCRAPGKPADEWIGAADLAEASRLCRDYIKAHDLGSGQWTGGAVVNHDGQPVGQVSFNGRVWAPGHWQSGDTPLFEPATPPPAVALNIRAALYEAQATEDAARRDVAVRQGELPLDQPRGLRR